METGRDQRRVPRQEVMRAMDLNAGGRTAIVAALLVAAVATLALVAQQPAASDVTSQHLLDGFKNPTRWLMYSGDYSGARHSPLTQITPSNANRLAAQWAFQVENMVAGRGFEGTPLMIDGALYVTGNNNTAWAIDARTGRQLWRHRRQLPSGLTYGAGNASNRGFAVLGDRLFMGTLDAHLVALDRHSGKVLWDIVVDDFKVG